VTHLNDIIYTYSIEATSQATAADDYSLFPALGGNAGKSAGAAPTTCPGILQTAESSYATIKSQIGMHGSNLNPFKSDGTYTSVKLTDTLTAWNALSGNLTSLKNAVSDLNGKCSTYTDAAVADFQTRKDTVLAGNNEVLSFQDKVKNNPHTWRGAVPMTVGATNHVTVTASESYQTQVTSGPVTQQCDIKSSVLSLSAGPLFSTISPRDYSTVTVPTTNNGQTTTYTALAVQDRSSLQPLLVGLLNYDLPFWAGNSFGIQLSSGPTFRIGGPSNVSSFGYFGGVSLHLWKRFFLTPGIHVAEFADFPVGFEANSPVPANFGTITPVRRWTAHFAISFTYRTNSISTLGQQNSMPAPTAPQKPAPPAAVVNSGNQQQAPTGGGPPNTGNK